MTRRSKAPLIGTRTAGTTSKHPQRRSAASPASEFEPGARSPRSDGQRHDRQFLRILSAHRDTTAVLGGAYPFLTGKPADDGMFIGHDTVTGERYCFDPWQLYQQQIVSNTNIAIVGNIGWGKTNTAMAIALRGIATGHRVLVPGDPKNDWTRLAEALGGQAIRIGPGMPERLNPLDLGTPPPGADEQAWRHQAEQRRSALMVAIVETLAPSLTPLHPEARETLTAATGFACNANTTATLHHVVTALAAERGEHAAPIRAALGELCAGPLTGMLDQSATATPDPSSPIIAVGTAAVADNDLAHTLAVLTATSQLDGATGAGRRFVIYDEAWRILAAPTHLGRVNAELRLSRARGTSTVLITHALSDTDKAADAGSSAAATARGLVALCDTRIIFRQAPGETDRTATELALTNPERGALADLGKGEALWKIGNTTRRIHTDLGPTEATLFDTDQYRHE
jgi:type IV secretory pathway VirB4 component